MSDVWPPLPAGVEWIECTPYANDPLVLAARMSVHPTAANHERRVTRTIEFQLDNHREYVRGSRSMT